ncbi:MAG TPA: formylglycine-generating enzyme family protein [Planctomycetaceae bacterium]|nr:formylglycine-generating enzyme family protein [Planctomycetaceae bacterium]HQZ67663.1 formylglycine-generating enzyme family protein [Planctomycetaceae bacterium]
MKLTLIPAGEFTMGSPADEKGTSAEGPQHRVRITQPFYMGIHEVTQGQFARFVGDQSYKTEAERDGQGGHGYNESENKFENDPKYTWKNTGFRQTNDHPVVNVTWNDAVAYCEWLSSKEGKKYRLPTEAEWEYACRAGTTTAYQTGNDDLEQQASIENVADGTAKEKFSDWLYAINARDGYVFTSPVGRFQSNGYGLYDMYGNLSEWCSDRYGSDYYGSSAGIDPVGASTGSYRVVRGGSWHLAARFCRSAVRLSLEQSGRNYDLGFRLALSPSIH